MKPKVSALTIAQSIQRSSDPIAASIRCFSRREVELYKKTYWFEDGSYIEFNTTYTVSCTGVEK